MTKIFQRIVMLGAVAAHCVQADEPGRPAFPPAYYSPAFACGGHALKFVEQHDPTNGVSEQLYLSDDKQCSLCLENISCERPGSDATFINLLQYVNQFITTNRGTFVEITRNDAQAEVTLTNGAQSVYIFKLPGAIQVWTYSCGLKHRTVDGADFLKIRGWVNRQRYEEALQAGNIDMGHWQKCVHDYARDLMKLGMKREALTVLKNLLATSPFDYEAHLEVLDNSPDAIAATNSARTVYKNAESEAQIGKAAGFVGATPKSLEKIKLLSTNETGLEVVLIPLPPCNPWLLDEAAKTYERITEVPVKIRRLEEPWTWGMPDRIIQQRNIQRFLIQNTKNNIDFKGWSKSRYVEALLAALKSEDELTKYSIRELIKKIENEPGQYLVDPYLDRLACTLMKYKSKDRRTMFVGITGANIYAGDSNFLFSSSMSGIDERPGVGIMSYHMMLADTLDETYASRPRLVERIAKEMVPASLKQLNIPRSMDPTCPYSYSSGLERLDQKTLNLSDDVKLALDKLRDQRKTPGP